MQRKVFSAQLNSLHKMLLFIQLSCQKRNFSSFLIEKIILAAEEALVNIINYSYQTPEQQGIIEITCEDCLEKPGVKISIKDQGIPFNPIEQVQHSLPSLTQENSSESLGGYGIYIFVGIMDRVEYQRDNEGNILSLIKYL